MEFHPKTLNLLMILSLINVYQYHTPYKKITQEHHAQP
jgi:hypothetical protein